ncbi:winged helix-turn-helix transcriptional regulator [Criibacterium bergeronii]|uniref:HTH domain-containing protein n=1 Tax=Criibacterium bergeronii TaxID=1871336 RepID=A0A371ILJ0_9FIRM|nr:winged helix-turn-helix transcriptional regulator [Criibacterium bergeronii]RDY21355.1 HTH domain-containing protein [Criibacterium bergeronii]
MILLKQRLKAFETASNYIRFTIPFDKDVGLNKTQKIVIELLIENPSYTSENLAEKIGVTNRTIKRAFKIFQEKKILERIGSKKSWSWIIIILNYFENCSIHIKKKFMLLPHAKIFIIKTNTTFSYVS